MAFLIILLLISLGWFLVRLRKEKLSRIVPAVFRQRPQAVALAQNEIYLRPALVGIADPVQSAPVETEAELDRYVRLCNASIEKFDHTDDLATKFYEQRLLEINLKELLRISPEHREARQVEQMIPELRRKLEAKLVESHKTHQPRATSTDWLAEIERAWQRRDFDTARQALQKVAYGMVDGSVTDEEREEFTQLMTAFASEDPLYLDIIDLVKPMVAENRGMLQSAIYQYFPQYTQEQVRYVLYFAHEIGDIHRRKKGRSYELLPPGRFLYVGNRAK